MLKKIESQDSLMQESTTEDELQKSSLELKMQKLLFKRQNFEITTILHNLEYITGNQVSITEGSIIEALAAEKEKNLRFDIQALEYDTKTKQSNANAQKVIIFQSYFR